MGIRTWWRRRRAAAPFKRHAVEVLRVAVERDAAEAALARQRVIDLARRQRDERDRRLTMSWVGPTMINGLPLLTYGQSRQYRVGR
ncbi:hypothetical protein ABGB21_31800 [Plantactinospora sp. B24E8]|uniref:hypothetical protein n=1 Tax=Plantactinospora sp. B5E13 TaxID=3153758 RepID=UPI00325F75F4